MCYILNATEDMKKDWHKCSKRMGLYLMKYCGIPVIHIDENKNYWVVKSDRLLHTLEHLPLLYKIFK